MKTPKVCVIILAMAVALMCAGNKAKPAPACQSEKENIIEEKATDRDTPTVNKPKGQKEHTARLEKNKRYNGGVCDLMALPANQLCIDQVWPRGLPVIPTKESDIVLLGRVLAVEAHLSTDKTRIYTESHVYVEDFLKLPSDQKPARENERVIDQIGGVLKLPSGQVIRDASRIDFLGGTRVGGRYVLFAKMIHHRKDLTLIRGYELRERRVFKLTDDGSPGNTLVSDIPGAEAIPSEEEEFIQTARNKLQNK